MPRYFIRISYKGTSYAGWQIQDNASSVQAVLNESLKTIIREEILTTGCGRTDAGVHASQFYAHFDTTGFVDDPAKVVNGLNAVLPDDIAAHEIIPVNKDAHARYDASRRTYEYFITYSKDPFLKEFSMLNYHRPDLNRMNKACDALKQCSDFSSFSKSNTQVKTNICQIFEAVWTGGEHLAVFRISADRFLRGMVRAIVGTMLEIGSGKMEPASIIGIIENKSRASAGVSVPASGLFLTKIEYPFLDSRESFSFPV